MILDQGVSEIFYGIGGRAYFTAEGWDKEWHIDEFLKYEEGKAIQVMTTMSSMEIQVNDDGDEVTWKYIVH